MQEHGPGYDELKWSGLLEQIFRFVVKFSFDGGKNLFPINQHPKKRILMEIRDEITKWNHWNHWNGNSGIPFYTPGPSGLKKKQTSRWSKVRSSCPESFLHIRSLEVLHEFSRRKFLRVHVPRHPPTEHQWDFVQILGKRWRNKWGMVMSLLAS